MAELPAPPPRLIAASMAHFPGENAKEKRNKPQSRTSHAPRLPACASPSSFREMLPAFSEPIAPLVVPVSLLSPVSPECCRVGECRRSRQRGRESLRPENDRQIQPQFFPCLAILLYAIIFTTPRVRLPASRDDSRKRMDKFNSGFLVPLRVFHIIYM